MKKINLQWIFSLLIILAITGCSKSHSVTNLKKYQEEYQNDSSTEFTDAQLEEMKAWVDDKIPYFMAETDKMIDAVHNYSMEKYGKKYYESSWTEDFNPDKLPEAIDWKKSMESIDGVNFGTMLLILDYNEKLRIYDDRYNSKENYYLSNFLWFVSSEAPSLCEFLDGGLLSLHSGEYSIDDLKRLTAKAMESDEIYL